MNGSSSRLWPNVPPKNDGATKPALAADALTCW